MVLADAVAPECVRYHAAAHGSTRECRSLALGDGAFPPGQACSYLPLLLLLDGLAVLLGQLVVIYFREW